MNTALNSYTLVKKHPVNTHADMENWPKIQCTSNPAEKQNPAMTHHNVLFPSHKQEF